VLAHFFLNFVSHRPLQNDDLSCPLVTTPTF